MTKMTYVKALEIAIAGMTDGEAKDKLIALKAQQEKKNSAERKPTKAQEANEATKAQMVEMLDEPMTATQVAEVLGISNQKASALLTALTKGDAPQVMRFEEKRKAYFKRIA